MPGQRCYHQVGSREYDALREGYCGLPMPEISDFDVELVSKVIQELKYGKAPGIDGLSAEHILYAHPTVVIVLSKLFALIAECCFVRARRFSLQLYSPSA